MVHDSTILVTAYYLKTLSQNKIDIFLVCSLDAFPKVTVINSSLDTSQEIVGIPAPNHADHPIDFGIQLLVPGVAHLHNPLPKSLESLGRQSQHIFDQPVSHVSNDTCFQLSKTSRQKASFLYQHIILHHLLRLEHNLL